MEARLLGIIGHAVDDAGTPRGDSVSTVGEATAIGVFLRRAVQQVGSHCTGLDGDQLHSGVVDINDHTEPRTLASIDCASNPGRKRVTVLSATAMVAPTTRARDLNSIVRRR